MNELTHINKSGNAEMVDVSTKDITLRRASAQSVIKMQPETLDLILNGKAKKGDVLTVARIAGIQAAKKCWDLIPLCHPLMISKISVDFEIDEQNSSIKTIATAVVEGKTGIEIEAITAASISAITIYDMCKAVDRGMVIGDTHILRKSGGKSGEYNFK
jgi:cyclic pyranopterin phosphate synthase